MKKVEDEAAYNRNRRARARAEGYCGICVTTPARPGRATCAKCVEAKRVSQARNLAKGLCETCGWPLAPGSTRSCLVHLRLNREASKAKAKERAAAGLCRSCGKERAPRSLQCEECRIFNRDRARERRGVRVQGLKSCGHCGRFGHNRRTCAEVAA